MMTDESPAAATTTLLGERIIDDDIPPSPHTASKPPSSSNASNIQFPTNKEIDRMVAQAMLELSPPDRQRALEELHGVVEEDGEDPDFVSTCLDDLDNCLSTIKQNTAYEEAERLSRSYVSSNRFRMMFLRSVRYIPQDAAERMINFFEYKKELFGVERLVECITCDDLHPIDRPIMENGYIQVSPIKDRVGRPILIFFEKVKKQYAKQAENAIRSQFYVYMSILEESEEVQKKGIVIIIYSVDCQGTTKSYGSRLRKSLPLRLASIHFCLNDEQDFVGANAAMRSLGSDARSRYRQHFGSCEEVEVQMSAFGIPKGILPIKSDGTVLVEEHRSWLQKRRQLENGRRVRTQQQQQQQQLSLTTGSCVTTKQIPSPPPSSNNSSNASSNAASNQANWPSSGDILFGRGRKVRDHPGNAQFLNLVDHYMGKYESAGRVDKNCIAEIIVRMIKDAGCRFLKKDEKGVWGEVADSEARKKVAHAFRNRRKSHGYGQGS